MSDPEISPAPQSEQDTAPPPQPPQNAKLTSASLTIWPPSQRTRDAVINRLIETLSSPSVLSKRYGTMSPDEAATAARHIEEEAFAATSSPAASGNDGIEILQVYSKEISKRMLDTVKSKSSALDNGFGQTPASDAASPAAAEGDPNAVSDAASHT